MDLIKRHNGILYDETIHGGADLNPFKDDPAWKVICRACGYAQGTRTGLFWGIRQLGDAGVPTRDLLLPLAGLVSEALISDGSRSFVTRIMSWMKQHGIRPIIVAAREQIKVRCVQCDGTGTRGLTGRGQNIACWTCGGTGRWPGKNSYYRALPGLVGFEHDGLTYVVDTVNQGDNNGSKNQQV